jgi:MYXO-CTERM domain-containing protein
MRPWWCAAAMLLFAGGALAQDAPVGSGPTDAPQPDKSVRDAEFGVVARHYGLERLVEMYQWRVAGQDYATTWSAQPIDSMGFAPGHANPPFPLKSRRWLAKSISIDGKPLDAEVIAEMGRWQDFRPGFSALPGNLAVTFQPEGDGLGSAENPLDPQVGDLRIHWRELVLPPLQGRIVLRDGRWRLPARQPMPAQDPGDQRAMAGKTSKPNSAPWWFGSGAVVLLIAALAARRRRRASKQSGN